MKKRKGLFLLEALLALLILASLAAALFPLAGQAAKAEILASVRGKLGNQGLFAMDFMVEKIRNNRRSMAGSMGTGMTTGLLRGRGLSAPTGSSRTRRS